MIALNFRPVHVLGLCDKSQFDQVYHYNVDEYGTPVYMGLSTSYILFNEVALLEVL